MPMARKDIVRDGEEGVYHCVNRCVRRAFLCGEDPYLGKNFDHRKVWVKDRLKFLADYFAIAAIGWVSTPSKACQRPSVSSGRLRVREGCLKGTKNGLRSRSGMAHYPCASSICPLPSG